MPCHGSQKFTMDEIVHYEIYEPNANPSSDTFMPIPTRQAHIHA